MTLFEYSARKPDQADKEKGEIVADSIGEATKKIRERGMTPISITEKSAKKGLSFKRRSVPLREKIIFTRQLAVMVKAGLPLVNALQALQKQTENNYFKEVIDGLINDVRGGEPLSKVMDKSPKVFPEVYVAVIRAGESTGQLSEVLMTLAEQQEKQAELISKVKGALMYPAIILIALLGVVGLIVFFVLPSMQSIFTDYDAELPLTTRLLFSTSNFAREYWWVLLLVTVAAIYALRLWVARPNGRLVYDRVRLIIPVFGGLTKKVYMANFARTMSMLTKASLPILQSIKIVQKTIANKHYDSAFNRIALAVENG
ncbi:MAG: type II secretion system F family protein, partial [Patescibacteria group bacterium]